MKREAQVSSDPSRHAGPSLLLLALVHVALFVASLVAFRVLAPGAPVPLPQDSEATVQRFNLEHGDAGRWIAFLQLGSAVVLGIFGAAVASQLQFLGVRAAGVWIAFFGGSATSLLLIFSSLCAWANVLSGVTLSGGSAKVLQLLSFAAGGPGFAVTFGLLAAGVSVTCGFARLLPRWAVWLGLGCALCGELASLALLSSSAFLLIPLTRFPGFLWMLVAAAKLPTSRVGTREAIS